MRCANAACQLETSYFRGGSLHCMDRSGASRAGVRGGDRQVVWLCPECSDVFVVETWRPAGEQLIRRRLPAKLLHRDPGGASVKAA
jgi:hypothetical protein